MNSHTWYTFKSLEHIIRITKAKKNENATLDTPFYGHVSVLIYKETKEIHPVWCFALYLLWCCCAIP